MKREAPPSTSTEASSYGQVSNTAPLQAIVRYNTRNGLMSLSQKQGRAFFDTTPNAASSISALPARARKPLKFLRLTVDTAESTQGRCFLPHLLRCLLSSSGQWTDTLAIRWGFHSSTQFNGVWHIKGGRVCTASKQNIKYPRGVSTWSRASSLIVAARFGCTFIHLS